MPTKADTRKYNNLLSTEKEKSEEELNFLKKYSDRVALFNDPPVSKSTINSLLRQYGWKVYKKKIALTGGYLPSFLCKGSDLEIEAVSLLSKIDDENYKLCSENIENQYILGRADVISDKKVIDLKISWNVNSFLRARISKLDAKYWYQMQGYMELYDLDSAEVVFLLLNTPEELIEKEKVRLLNRFMMGEIDRDKYELEIGNIESAFTYENIPLKKRHFRYKIQREPKIMDKIYKRVDKSRLWLKEFERSMRKNSFVVPSDLYIDAEENNIELDPSNSCQINTGG